MLRKESRCALSLSQPTVGNGYFSWRCAEGFCWDVSLRSHPVCRAVEHSSCGGDRWYHLSGRGLGNPHVLPCIPSLWIQLSLLHDWKNWGLEGNLAPGGFLGEGGKCEAIWDASVNDLHTHGHDRSQNQQGGNRDLSSLFVWEGIFVFGRSVRKRMFSCLVVKSCFCLV